MIRFVPWSEVGTITVSPGDDLVEVGEFELAEGADTLWVRMTNTGTPGPWPWSYGILSFKTDEGQPLGSIKAYNSFEGEVFRLGVGLTPSVRSGVLTFEPRGFNMAWIQQGNDWSLKFEAQSGGQSVSNTYWSRVPGTLAPSNEGDDVDLGTGSLIADSASFADGKSLLKDDGSIWSEYGRAVVGDQFQAATTNLSGIELRAGDFTPYGAIRVQGPSGTDTSAAAIAVRRGSTPAWEVTYGGTSFVRQQVVTPDLALVSSDPSHYRVTTDDVNYDGPVISLLDEIIRLEALVKELYDKLRMSPEAGWPVWDGNEDLMASNIAKTRHI